MAPRTSTGAERLGRELLETAGIELGGGRPWDIHVHDPRFFDRVLAQRELGLGESYQDGWWDVESLDAFIARVIEADLQSKLRPSPRLIGLVARSTLANRQTVRRAGAHATAHYDMGNDLFRRMLDRRMIYSCAYWADADDLDSAQEAKLELICSKLGLEPGMRLLDIGCGWGGLAEYAADIHGCAVTGISPVAEQVKVARERTRGLAVDIRQTDYRTVQGRFDRIVSVGMMEHVGHRNLGTFFVRCRELLADGGMMLHHTIGSNRSNKNTDPWFDKYIFPGGVLPGMAQIAGAAEDAWAIEDVQNLGPYYDRTLMAWHDNLEKAWPQMPAYDERFQRTWRYYLLSSAASFRVRNMQLFQVVFRRSRRRSEVYRAPR